MSLKVLLATASLALCLAFGELGVRLFYGGEHAPRPIFYQKNEQLGWSPSPGLDDVFYGGDFSIRIRTGSMGDRLGMRGDWSSAGKLIVLAGDSNAFGWGVNTDETFASHLDVRLRPRGSALVNLGVGGYGTSQSALRLEEFASRVERERVDAVIMLHSRNDMTDNVSFLLYENGYRKHFPTRPTRSRFHLVNMIRQRVSIISQGSAEPSSSEDNSGFDGERSREEDVLFSFPLTDTDREPGAIHVTPAFAIHRREITQADINPVLTSRRACLSELQYSLVVAYVERINCVFAGTHTPVVHTLLGADPLWMEDVYREIITSADTCGAPVFFRGRVSTDGFVGETRNSHSGGHFTSALNEHYALVMGAWIDREDFGVPTEVSHPENPKRTVCDLLIPQPVAPPDTGDSGMTRVAFEDPLEQNHLSMWNYRLNSVDLSSDGRSLTCDILGSDIIDAAQYAGVRFPVDGLGALKFELSFESPENIRILYVDGYGEQGRLLRWVWYFEPLALPAKPEVHTLIPGHGSGYLSPFEESSGEGVTQVHVFVRLNGLNRRTSFTIRDVQVAPVHSSGASPAT